MICVGIGTRGAAGDRLTSEANGECLLYIDPRSEYSLAYRIPLCRSCSRFVKPERQPTLGRLLWGHDRFQGPSASATVIYLLSGKLFSAYAPEFRIDTS